MLSSEEVARFKRDGMVTVSNAVSSNLLARLQGDFATWVAESRSHDAAYGSMIDGRPRFDVETGHSADAPALRRVSSPTEVSAAFEEAAFDSAMGNMVAALIGPSVRFHHSKINSKLPGSKTVVKWHQDFAYDPHSNDDVITALLFLDDVTPENGPLRVAPGSHTGAIHTLWHDGVFTGAVSETVAAQCEQKPLVSMGQAGSVCLMHGRAAHASDINASDRARTLFIAVYAAADAIPLAPNPVPSDHAGRLVRGVEPGRIRSQSFDMDIPEYPKGASFFVQQKAAV